MKNHVPLTEFTLSFDWNNESGSADLDFKHVSVEGTRAEDFDTVYVLAHAPITKKVAIRFVGLDIDDAEHDELPAGDGPIANLWFSASGSGTLTMDTITLVGHSYDVESRYVDYLPEFRLFHMWTAMRGDANDDEALNTGDPVYLINHVFKSGPPPPTTYHGDANDDDDVNVGDAVYLINHIFLGGPAPPP
jgi:hypothetical protein